MSGFFKSMEISSSGLSAQRIRMNILSSTLAHAQTTRFIRRERADGRTQKKDALESAD